MMDNPVLRTESSGATIAVALSASVAELLDILEESSGVYEAALVGGAVRDGVAGVPIRDFDFLVYAEEDAAVLENLREVYPNVQAVASGSQEDLSYIVIENFDEHNRKVEILLTDKPITKEIDEYPDDISQLAIFGSSVDSDGVGELYLTTAAINAFATKTINIRPGYADRGNKLADKFPDFTLRVMESGEKHIANIPTGPKRPLESSSSFPQHPTIQ